MRQKLVAFAVLLGALPLASCYTSDTGLLLQSDVYTPPIAGEWFELHPLSPSSYQAMAPAERITQGCRPFAGAQYCGQKLTVQRAANGGFTTNGASPADFQRLVLARLADSTMIAQKFADNGNGAVYGLLSRISPDAYVLDVPPCGDQSLMQYAIKVDSTCKITSRGNLFSLMETFQQSPRSAHSTLYIRTGAGAAATGGARARAPAVSGGPGPRDIAQLHAHYYARYYPGVSETQVSGETITSAPLFGSMFAFHRSVDNVRCQPIARGSYKCSYRMMTEVVPTNGLSSLATLLEQKVYTYNWTETFSRTASGWASAHLDSSTRLGAQKDAADRSATMARNNDDARSRYEEEERKRKFDDCMRSGEVIPRYIPCSY